MSAEEPPAAVSPVDAEVSSFRAVGSIPGRIATFPAPGGTGFLARGPEVIAEIVAGEIVPRPELSQRLVSKYSPVPQRLDAIRRLDATTIWGAWAFQWGWRASATWNLWDGKRWLDTNSHGHLVRQIAHVGGGGVDALNDSPMGPEDTFSTPLALVSPKGSPRQIALSRPGFREGVDPPGCRFVLHALALLRGVRPGTTHRLGMDCRAGKDQPQRLLLQTFTQRGETTSLVDLDLGLDDPRADVSVSAVMLADDATVLSILEAHGSGPPTRKHRLVRREGEGFVTVPLVGFVGEPSSFVTDDHDRLYFMVPRAPGSPAPEGGSKAPSSWDLWSAAFADGRAKRIALPEGAGEAVAPPALLAASERDVWVFVPRVAGHTDVFRNAPDAKRIEGDFPDRNAERDALSRRRRAYTSMRISRGVSTAPIVTPTQWGVGCDTPFVYLSYLPENAAHSHDTAVIRRALEGHPEIAGTQLWDCTRDGDRYLGATVPSAAVGEIVQGLVLRLVASHQRYERPMLVCDRPPPDARPISLKPGDPGPP